MPGTKDHALLNAVVDTAVDGVILIDAKGAIIMFNPACERLFGYGADEIIGKNVNTLMPPVHRHEHDQCLDDYKRTKQKKIIGISREVIGQCKDGSTFPMDLSVGETKLADGSVFVGIIHDLRERKKTEAQLIQAQKMESVGQLSGGIAHDFNNLLTVIIGNAEVLGERLRARPDLKQYCDLIIGAGERGAELTDRLLAFSRRQTLLPAAIDCNKMVESMQALLHRMLREDIVVDVKLEPDLLPALADPAQLESALLNLALNAQDAMPDGGHIMIHTANAPLDPEYRHTHPDVKSGHYVLIAVTDDGEGMTDAVRERVFEPFFTTKEVGKGSGLGLSMVYGFVKQSGGHVGLYSEPGLGTTVRLYLPIAGMNSVAVGSSLENDQDDIPLGKETVLLVEDDAFVRGYAIATLESLGYTVLTATNGLEALTCLNRGANPDILFTDIVMPGGINGHNLADEARKLRPHLKILLTSGYPLETLEARGHRPANSFILKKPYRKAELARRLREALDKPILNEAA